MNPFPHKPQSLPLQKRAPQIFRWRVGGTILFLAPLLVWLFLSTPFLMPAWPWPNFSGEVTERIPIHQPGVFRLAVFSDVHLNWRVMAAILAETENKADAAIFLGDFAQRGLPIEYRLYIDSARKAGVKIPLFTALGNHDLGFWDDSGELFRKVFGPDHFAWSFGENLILVINNVENDLWPSQLTWLQDQLRSRKKEQGSVILLQHKPPYLKSDFPGMGEGRSEKLGKIASGSAINQIVAGHAHEHKEFTWNQVPVTVLGTAGGWQEKEPPVYGYLLLECSASKCSSSYHEVGFIPAGVQAAKILLVDAYWGWFLLSGLAASFLLGTYLWNRRRLKA